MKAIDSLSLRNLLIAVLFGASLIGSASAAIYSELPDAGEIRLTANDATSVSPLTGISGELSAEPGAGSDLVDMYKISIPNGVRFFANTGPGTDPALIADPVLFLFDALGFGVAMDDELGGLGQASLSTGTLAGGFYFLAIAFAGLEPLDDLDNPIFDTFGSGAPLSLRALDSWIGGPLAIDLAIEGRYAITMHSVPVPATLLLAALGLVALRATHKSRSRRA